MRFAPGLLPISDTMVAWLASKFCKPQKWSKKRAKCSSQSLITDHESPITNHFLWSPFIFLPSSLLLRCRSGELVWYNFSYERSNSAAERNERRREAANHGGALAKSLS